MEGKNKKSKSPAIFYNKEIIDKLEYLYQFNQKFEKELNKPINKQIFEEYYFINFDWINKFMDHFNYKSFKKIKDGYGIDSGSSTEIGKKFRISIHKDDIESNLLKIDQDLIDCEKNLIHKKSNQNKKIDYYTNFALLDRETYEKITKGYFFNEFPTKTDILLGDKLILFKLNKKTFEIIKTKDNFIYNKKLFIFNYKDEYIAKNALKYIQKNSFKEYVSNFNINLNETLKYNLIGLMLIIELNIESNSYVNNNQKVPKQMNHMEQDITTAGTYTPNLNNNTFIENRNLNLLDCDKSSGYKNAVINCFISIKNIKSIFDKNKDKFLKNKNKYMLSASLTNLISESGNKRDNYSESNLVPFKVITDFIKPNIGSIKDFFIFLLETLQKEYNKISNNKSNNQNIKNYQDANNYNIHFEESNKFYQIVHPKTYNLDNISFCLYDLKRINHYKNIQAYKEDKHLDKNENKNQKIIIIYIGGNKINKYATLEIEENNNSLIKYNLIGVIGKEKSNEYISYFKYDIIYIWCKYDYRHNEIVECKNKEYENVQDIEFLIYQDEINK